MFRIANIITALRIILSVFLLLLRPLSIPFCSLYILCGLTDIADGCIARKTHTQSDFGAKLDSAADIVFIVICMVRLLPIISLKLWVWGFIILIILVKLINIACGLAIRKKLCFLHTKANKLTGLMLFVLPLTFSFIDVNMIVAPVCIFALLAAVQEGYLIITENQPT